MSIIAIVLTTLLGVFTFIVTLKEGNKVKKKLNRTSYIIISTMVVLLFFQIFNEYSNSREKDIMEKRIENILLNTLNEETIRTRMIEGYDSIHHSIIASFTASNSDVGVEIGPTSIAIPLEYNLNCYSYNVIIADSYNYQDYIPMYPYKRASDNKLFFIGQIIRPVNDMNENMEFKVITKLKNGKTILKTLEYNDYFVDPDSITEGKYLLLPDEIHFDY
jgi:hypothetical protein